MTTKVPHGCCSALLLFGLPFLVLAQTELYVPGGTVGTSTNGNIGIGTSAPQHKLHVAGSILADSASYPGLYVVNGTTTLAAIQVDEANNIINIGDLYGAAPSLALRLFTADVERFRINANGNIGIGTSNPQGALDLGNATGGRGITWGGPSGSGRYATIFTPYSAGGMVLATGFHGSDSSDSYLSSYGSAMGRSAIRLNAFGTDAGAIAFFADTVGAISAGSPFVPSERMRLSSSGNFGIGRSSDLYARTMVQIASGSAIPSLGTGGGHFALSNGSYSVMHGVRTDGKGWIQAQRTDGAATAYSLLLQPNGGNIGIGTTSPSHKVTVNGTIRAKEIIVDTGWADYVFADDYRLAPLDEVEAHIKEHRHLPGIPSAAEVAEHGVSLGEMQSRILAQVEELTLHVIDLKKENQALRRELEALKSVDSTR